MLFRSINICKYLQDNQKDFKPYTLTSYHTESLKSLSRDRFSIIEELRKAKLDVYRILSQLFPEYLKLFSNIYQGSALEIITKYPSPKKLAKAHLETISNMLHGKCKTTAEDIINAAKASIGNNNDYLSFSLVQAIKTLNFIQSKINDYDEMTKKENNGILLFPSARKKLASRLYNTWVQIPRNMIDRYWYASL